MAEPIIISNPQDYINLYDLTNVGSENDLLDIQFVNDLDFSQYSDFPKFYNKKLFANIHGNGHRISNIVLPGYDATFSFFCLGKNSMVSNLKFSNCYVTSPSNALALFMLGDSTASNEGVSALEDIEIDNTNRFSGSSVYIIYDRRNGSGTVYNNPVRIERVGISGEYICTANNGTFMVNNTTGVFRYCYIAANIDAVTFRILSGSVTNGASNCWSKCKFSNRLTTHNPFGPSSVHYCYVANEVNLNRSANNGGLSTTSNISIEKSYYDADLNPNSYYHTQYGVPSENLKSESWLRENFWAI